MKACSTSSPTPDCANCTTSSTPGESLGGAITARGAGRFATAPVALVADEVLAVAEAFAAEAGLFWRGLVCGDSAPQPRKRVTPPTTITATLLIRKGAFIASSDVERIGDAYHHALEMANHTAPCPTRRGPPHRKEPQRGLSDRVSWALWAELTGSGLIHGVESSYLFLLT